jgi:putative ABC transport system permease protein
MLILVVLLGTGQGFRQAIMNVFSAFAQKSIFVYGGITSDKKEIRFDMDYLQGLRQRYEEIDAISPEMSLATLVSNKAKSGVFNVFGISADYMRIKLLRVQESGRLFTPADITQSRPVAIIGEQVAATLLENKNDYNNYITIGGVLFHITGIIKNENLFSAAEINSIYVPYSSFQKIIKKEHDFSSFCLCLNSNSNSEIFENNLRNHLSYKYKIADSDKQAVYVANFETQTSLFESLFSGIRSFIWGVGVCFLISGIVGISNIMFVVVKERTNEIGIRLSVGALPRSIMKLVLLESIIITTIAGIIGIIFGNGILMLIDKFLSMSKDKNFIWHTSPDITVATVALIILILSGLIAGSFPALKAASIEPIDAIRYENRG